MVTKRPMIKTKYSPSEIMGIHEEMVTAHYVLCLKADVDGFDKLINKTFAKSERQIVAQVYDNLRQRGYYIYGVDMDKLVFSKILTHWDTSFIYKDGDLIDANSNPPTKKEIEEMRIKTRNDLRKLKSPSRPEPEDYDLF